MGFPDRFRRIERRGAPRKRVVSTVWIDAGDGSQPLVCVLWDVSQGGARLAIADPNAVPDEFRLLFSRSEKPGSDCRVVWRTHEQIGIKYVAMSSTGARMLENMISYRCGAGGRQ